MDPNNTRVLKSLYTPVRDASRRAYYSSSPIEADTIKNFQNSLQNIASESTDANMQNQFKNLLVAWNKATGKFNSAAKSPPCY